MKTLFNYILTHKVFVGCLSAATIALAGCGGGGSSINFRNPAAVPTPSQTDPFAKTVKGAEIVSAHQKTLSVNHQYSIQSSVGNYTSNVLSTTPSGYKIEHGLDAEILTTKLPK